MADMITANPLNIKSECENLTHCECLSCSNLPLLERKVKVAHRYAGSFKFALTHTAKHIKEARNVLLESWGIRDKTQNRPRIQHDSVC